jgi:HPt (histidine-containing phosphotransfer) domain-containing protein
VTILDDTILAELRSLGDEEFLTELFGTYALHAEKQLALMRGALAAADRIAFRRYLHAIAGASLNVGATGVATACREAEEALDDKGSVPQHGQLAHVETEIGNAVAALWGLARPVEVRQ